MLARHLPPSAALPRVLALDSATAAELAEAAEVTLDAGGAPPGPYDAIAGRRLATAEDVHQLAARLRPGGRLILAAQARPEALLGVLTGAGLIHCLVENVGGLTLYRGERPPETVSTQERARQLAAEAAHGTQPPAPRFLFLLVTQTPNKPAWKLAPGERVEWRAATVATPDGPRLLAFSSLVKAVAYMQPAVLAGAIHGVNKVAKFPASAAAGWLCPLLLNPRFDDLRGLAAGPPLAVDPLTAMTGEE
jgi:hypothetical protein